MRGALAVLLLLAGCSAGGAETAAVVDRLEGRAPLTVAIESRAPYDFAEALAGGGAEGLITARLSYPAEGVPIRGAAILSHGSGGPGGRQERMAERLAEAGIATMLLDHFGSRGIGSTVRDQLRVTAQGMLADIRAARDLLATHPEIAPERIGAIGWSKGAIAASLGAVERLAGYVGLADPPLAFAVAFYPFCGFDLDGERLAAPLLYLLGAEDDWTPAGPCLRQARAWEASGQPVAAALFDGAGHGFDARGLFDIRIGRAITVRDTSPRCTLTVDAAGRTVTLTGGDSLVDLPGRQAFLARCGVRGVTFAADSAARAAAYARLDVFLDRVLGPEE